LSVFLQFTASDYTFGISKFFLLTVINYIPQHKSCGITSLHTG